MRLWDADSRHETRIIPGHSDALFAASFSPDGSRLATCGADQTIKLWAVDNGKLMRSFRGQAGDLAFSPDGKLLASVGDDGSAKIWDADARPRRDSFREPVGPVGFNEERKLVAFGANSKTMLVDPVSLQASDSSRFTLTNSRIIVDRLDVRVNRLESLA